MSGTWLGPLAGLLGIVGVGWLVGRARLLGPPEADPPRVLGNAAFFLFAPALLFRTTARLDLSALPWPMLLAYFGPIVALGLVHHGWRRHRRARVGDPVAGPAVQVITLAFGNSVNIGIPLAAAVFGEAGLGLHLTLVSVHALVLLTFCTTLVELDLARDPSAPRRAIGAVMRTTLRSAVVHPVTLPVLAGLAWGLTGLGLAPAVDAWLELIGRAVVPLCLALVGLALAYPGPPISVRSALGMSAAKLILQPLLVLGVAYWGFELRGLPLSVPVMMAALPSGANALLFAQRYGALQAQTAAVNLLSTVLFAGTAPLWLLVLEWIA
jgi:predicted permease